MSSLQLTHPLVLSLLLFLPLLWRLLRHIPPVPRRQFFGGTMLLTKQSERSLKTHHHLWLTLLRLLALALLIVAASLPRWHPDSERRAQASAADSAPPLLIVDNDWASGKDFAAMQQQATQWLARHNDALWVFATAAQKNKPLSPPQLMSARAAKKWIAEQQPRAWHGDYDQAQRLLKEIDLHSALWVTHDMAQVGKQTFAAFLADETALTVALTPLHRLAIIEKAAQESRHPIVAQMRARDDEPHELRFVSSKGRTQSAISARGQAAIALPETPVHDAIADVMISRQNHAAAHLLFAQALQSLRVGIIKVPRLSPLLEETHYITQSLAELAIPQVADVPALLQQRRVIIRPDQATLAPSDEESLHQWVRDGGHLIRFAGAQLYHLADSTPLKGFTLTPLQQGELSERFALKPMPFSEDSPLFGLPLPDELAITPRLLLRDQERAAIDVWARLEGGIPWIISRAYDKGRETLILTTANTQWSDLVLSPLFPPLLERLTAVQTTFVADDASSSEGEWDALITLNGYGEIQKESPPAIVTDFSLSQPPSANHPPGVYRHRLNGIMVAHNLGNHISDLTPFADFPANARFLRGSESGRAAIDLAPYLALLALLLWLADLWLLRFLTQLCLLVILLPAPLLANINDNELRAASHPTIGIISHAGQDEAWLPRALKGISDATSRRTTATIAAPQAVNLNKDALSLFPMLYWRFDEKVTPLTKEQAARLNRYMSEGGILLLDVSAWEGDVTTILPHLVVPRLSPLPYDHALMRSFYLLERAPQFNNDDVWVSRTALARHDHVSPLIVLNHDYARAWLTYHISNHSASPFSAPPARSVDGAMRFGVNLLLYGLTGQYKKDQVHLDVILKRLKNRAR